MSSRHFESISYWERWPGETGQAPSFDNLAKVAAVYECSVGDLLTDLPDYREQDASTPSWWYFYNESFYWSTQAQCRLELHEPDAALDALNKSLSLLDPANLHEYTFRQLFIAEARIQQGEIDQAADIIAAAVRQSAVNSAERITQSFGRLRQLLAPWERTPAVRDLDAQLVTYRPGVAIGSGRT